VGRITISNRKIVAEATEKAYISMARNFTGVYRGRDDDIVFCDTETEPSIKRRLMKELRNCMRSMKVTPERLPDPLSRQITL